MIVVKANGYGHGAINIANFLSKNSAIIFCVFTIEEATKLRESGVKNPILIFSRIHKSWIDLSVKYNFWVNACHIDDLKLLDKFYNEKIVTNYFLEIAFKNKAEGDYGWPIHQYFK